MPESDKALLPLWQRLRPRVLWLRIRGRQTLRQKGLCLAIGLLVGLLCSSLLARFGTISEMADETFYRTWLAIRNARMTPADLGIARSRVVLVTLDKAAREKYGFPFPRDKSAAIVDRLVEAGASTIAINVLFEVKNSDPDSGMSLKAIFHDPHVVLPYRIGTQDNRVVRVLPYAGFWQGMTPDAIQAHLGFSAIPGRRDYWRGGSEVRAVWLKVAPRDEPPLYGFSLMALAHNLKITPEELLAQVRIPTKLTAVRDVPVEAREAWVNFPGMGLVPGHNTNNGTRLSSLLPTITISELIDTPFEELHGRLGTNVIAVLSTAETTENEDSLTPSGQADRKGTLVGRLSGPEIVICIIMNLILDNFLIPSTPGQDYAYGVAAAVFIGLLGGWLNLRWLVIGSVATGAGVALAAYSALVTPGFGPGALLPVVGPILNLSASSLAMIYLHLRFARLRRGQRVLDLVDEVCPAEVLPPTQGQVLTVLLVDLYDYKNFIEQNDAITGSNVLRDYFTAISRVYKHFGGVVFDYSNGGQWVVFGLVVRSQNHHAQLACQAAAALVWEAEELRRQALPLPLNRVGVATGELVFGTKFSSQALVGKTGKEVAELPRRARQWDAEVVLTETTLVWSNRVVPTTPITAQAGLHRLNVPDTWLCLQSSGGMAWHYGRGVAAAASQLKEGDDLNHYHLEQFLGQGGMGRVFLATDTRLRRSVAIKVILGQLTDHHAKRFLKEARAVARAQHPGIVAIYEVGLEPFPYLAMEFSNGRDLKTILRDGPMEPDLAVKMILQVLDAVGVVHQQGVVHRDLKPANIMLTEGGKVMLMDFGLATVAEEESTRLTRTGQLCGTPQYMAPEQLEPDLGEVDAISDIFAVATVLYESLAGVPTVKGANVSMIIYELVFRQPTPPHMVNPKVPEDLSLACMRGLHKTKADRYQSAEEFALALRSLLSWAYHAHK